VRHRPLRRRYASNLPRDTTQWNMLNASPLPRTVPTGAKTHLFDYKYKYKYKFGLVERGLQIVQGR